MRTMAMLGAVLVLAGCGHLPFGRRPVPRGGETITYATTRCFGTCPAYVVTLGPDGQGIFVGQAFTAASGEHRFQASREQVDAFADRLRPFRPDSERLIVQGEAACGQARTDAPSVDVRWRAADGAAHLAYYYGCEPAKNGKLADALRTAPAVLPIAELIGAR